jgi:peptidoglycan hydrolase-like protein with peptidoglycan-binding domain
MARRTVLAALTILALCAPAATAAAQSPVPTPTPTPTPAPAPPAAGHLKLVVRAPYRDRGSAVALRGDRVRADGQLTPPAAGQVVIVRVALHDRRLLAKRVHTHADGTFAASLPLRRPGSLVITAVHRATRVVLTARASRHRVLVVRPAAGFGARGPLVRLLQRGLARLRYAVSSSGLFDASTGRAVIAYRKVNRRPRIPYADAQLVRAVLAGRGAYHVRHPGAGHHVEADLSRQILALVDGSRLDRVYTTSSGKPSTPTIVGTFHVYSKTPGYNSEQMYFTSYFQGGYGIHGYFDVPVFNASHGCLRVPIPDARAIYAWLRVGDTVIVQPR